MGRSTDTRGAILDAAYVLFRRLGYGRVNLDDIARRANVTKRTLYYHFASKDDLLAAMLDAQSARALAAYRSYGDKLDGTPAEIVDRLFEELALWSSVPRWPGSGFTRAAVELADLPGHPARRIAREHKRALESLLADRLRAAGLAEADLRTREIQLLVEGAIVLILIHGDPAYAAVAAGLARRIVNAPAAVPAA